MSKLSQEDKYYSTKGVESSIKSKTFDTALEVFFAREFPPVRRQVSTTFNSKRDKEVSKCLLPASGTS